MSYKDYQLSIKLAAEAAKLDPDPFYALIMAAARFADNVNQERLLLAFPNQCRELGERYRAGGGVLPEDRDDPEFRWKEYEEYAAKIQAAQCSSAPMCEYCHTRHFGYQDHYLA